MKLYEHDYLFPDEAFDKVELDDSDDEKAVYSTIVKDIRQASKQVRDAYESGWDINHELELSDKIQAGLEHQRSVDAGAATFDASITMQANQAKHDLVVANLPFAIYFANASVGKRHIPQTKSGGVAALPRDDSDYMGRLKEPGTYARIANLAHPRASLEDRIQVAMEAMWNAADNYIRPPIDKKPAKFITYAAWHIQNELTQESIQENGGWHMSRSIYGQYKKILDEMHLYDSPLPETLHKADGSEKHQGFHPQKVFAGRESIPLDLVRLPNDETDEFDEPDLAIHEVVPDNRSEREIIDYTDTVELMDTLGTVLNTFSEREANVVIMRFGLDDGRWKSLVEIGKVLGITRERVRQIESIAMSKLRYSAHNTNLGDFLDPSIDHSASLAVTQHIDAEGAGHIKTERFKAVSAKAEDEDIIVEDQPQRPRHSWQAYEDEPWDVPVRTAKPRYN